MIEFADVTVTLGGTRALESVSLAVDRGEFLALVGPNGAGKTTLLRTCNGVLTPDTGRVTVTGDAVADLDARAVSRRVATVPQETTLGFDFPVRDVVAMGRTPHRPRLRPASDADAAAVAAALERTRTERFADRAVGDLSGGERQRVVLARALAQDTPVLLLDEPTASLDINHQVATLAFARELADEDRTVVAAIHDLELAARFCDRMALLDDGRLLATGDPASVLTPERLEGAFGVRTAVGTDPVTGTPTVTALTDAPPTEKRVHVVGGGPRAAGLIASLADAGVDVTAGVLPPGDVATETATALASTVVTAPPYRDVPRRDREAVGELVEAADATVLAAEPPDAIRSLVHRSDRLLALPGVDGPASAVTVDAADVPAAIEEGAAWSVPTARE